MIVGLFLAFALGFIDTFSILSLNVDILSQSDLSKTENIQNQIILLKKYHISQTVVANDVCKFNVSQNTTKAFLSIAEGIEHESIEFESYEITLLDFEHFEHLEINMYLPVLIKSKNGIETFWRVNSTAEEIIFIQLGNLTLESLLFSFTSQQFPSRTIIPNKALIYISSDEQTSTLTVRHCTFQSISTQSEGNINQIYGIDVNRVEIFNCTFKGIGAQKELNITMINLVSCNDIIIQNCSFMNASTQFVHALIWISSYFKNGKAYIQNNNFTNLCYNGSQTKSVLMIQGAIGESKSLISGNIFMNCITNNSFTGALLIYDQFQGGNYNEFIIENNTFKQNFGNLTGAIFLQSENDQSKISFRNNTFISNKNIQEDEIGKDGFLEFYNPSTEWNINNIIQIFQSLFEGSTSEANMNSIYYKVFRNQILDLYGKITLPSIPQPPLKKEINKYIIIGIVSGSVLLVIIIIIIIAIVCWKKKKSALILKWNKFQDPLGSYRSI